MAVGTDKVVVWVTLILFSIPFNKADGIDFPRAYSQEVSHDN